MHFLCKAPFGRGNALRFVHTFKAPGWSVRPKRFAGLLLRLRPIGLALRATPSAPSLSSAQPPLLCEEGNGHGGRERSIWPVESSSDDQNDAEQNSAFCCGQHMVMGLDTRYQPKGIRFLTSHQIGIGI